jgi:uncharacterized protein YkwD
VAETFQAQEQQLLQMVNDYRAANHLSRLSFDSRLTAAAQNLADYMARTGDYTHTESNGLDLTGRLRAAGASITWAGENIMYYDPSLGRHLSEDQLPGYFLSAWKGSPGHNQNLLASRALEAGIAFARATDGNVYASLIVARPI